LVTSGDSTAGASAGAVAAGFVLGFFVETLGINKIKLIGLAGFQFPDCKSFTHWTAGNRKSSKWIFIYRAFKAIVTSIRQGKFRSQLAHTLTQLARHVKPPNRIFLVRFSVGRVL
jgi:hypothetical protein